MKNPIIRIDGNEIFVSEIAYTRQLDALASGLEFFTTDFKRYPSDSIIELEYNNVIVFEGNISEIPSRDDTGVRYQTCDHSSDLVDCAATSSPGSWKNTTAAQAVQDVLKPYNFSVLDYSEKLRFDKIELKDGETVIDFMNRLLLRNNILPVYLGKRVIKFDKINNQTLGVDLVHGVNIATYSESNKFSEQYSEYHCYSTAIGVDSFGEIKTPIKTVVKDNSVKRYRPTHINCDGANSMVQLKKRGLFEIAQRRAKSRTVTIGVNGWEYDGINIWKSNAEVALKSQKHDIDENMLVSGIKLISDCSGMKTELSLCDLKAYDEQ